MPAAARPTGDLMRPLWLRGGAGHGGRRASWPRSAVTAYLGAGGCGGWRCSRASTVAVLGAHVAGARRGPSPASPRPGTWAIASAQLVGALVATLLVADLLDPRAVPARHRPAPGRRRRPTAAHPAGHHPRPAGRGEHGRPRPARPTRTADAVRGPSGPDGRARERPGRAHRRRSCVLLWRLRLRPSAPLHLRLDLATLLPLVLTAISVASILVVTGVLISQIRASQIDQVERNFQTLADIHAERVGNAPRPAGRGSPHARAARHRAPGRAGGGQRQLSRRGRPDGRPCSRSASSTWETSPDSSDFVLQYRNNPGRSS